MTNVTSAPMTDSERDPRPDLASDHALWVALLTEARATDTKSGAGSDLWAMLHCMRCCGAALAVDKDYGLILRPGEWDQKEYDAYRAQYLAPRRDAVVKLLKAAAPKAQEETVRVSVVARVKAIEPRLLALGWTSDEIWAPEDKGGAALGARESLFVALFGAVKTWGRVELGHVTVHDAEFVVYQGASNVSRLRHRKAPAGAAGGATQQVLLTSAASKKEAV